MALRNCGITTWKVLFIVDRLVTRRKELNASKSLKNRCVYVIKTRKDILHARSRDAKPIKIIGRN